MPKKTLKSLELELREHAMDYPEATEDFPWGHRAIKINGKAFVFLGGDANPKELSMSVKLPQSRDMAVDLPFGEPTGYGMGKYGWVTARFTNAADVPLDLLRSWIDESFRAIAPKRMVKALEGRAGVPPAPAGHLARPHASRGRRARRPSTGGQDARPPIAKAKSKSRS